MVVEEPRALRLDASPARATWGTEGCSPPWRMAMVCEESRRAQFSTISALKLGLENWVCPSVLPEVMEQGETGDTEVLAAALP